MISDLDVYRSANILVDKHGADAPIHAAQQAAAMLDKGDLDGRATWLRVVMAVEALLAKKPPEWTVVQ